MVVVGGTLLNGKVKAGQKYYYGPCQGGQFVEVEVSSNHCLHTSLDESIGVGCFALELKSGKVKLGRKSGFYPASGMVLVDGS